MPGVMAMLEFHRESPSLSAICYLFRIMRGVDCPFARDPFRCIGFDDHPFPSDTLLRLNSFGSVPYSKEWSIDHDALSSRIITTILIARQGSLAI
jgi:hypothetical protein